MPEHAIIKTTHSFYDYYSHMKGYIYVVSRYVAVVKKTGHAALLYKMRTARYSLVEIFLAVRPVFHTPD
jgi:hypothetical protein